jgi:hypothetical protein
LPPARVKLRTSGASSSRSREIEMASLKKKKKNTSQMAQKSKPKKAADFTVNSATGKRTLSGAEASRRISAAGGNTVVRNANNNLRSGIFDNGALEVRTSGKYNLPVSSGGKISGTSFGLTKKYFPSGTRTRRGGR